MLNVPGKNSSEHLTIIGNTAFVTLKKASGRVVRTVGGSGFNIAAASSFVGVRPNLVTVVGSDFGVTSTEMLRSVCTFDGVRVEEGPTAKFQFRYSRDGGEPHITSRHGVARHSTEHAIASIAAPAWFHLSCRRPIDCAKVLTHIATASPIGISLDFILPSSQDNARRIGENWRAIDLVFVNDSEFNRIQPILTRFGFHGTAVVTSGPAGARVYRHGEVVAAVEAVPTQEVDPSGAGDTFAGAYLAHMLRRRHLAECLANAASVAALTVASDGVSGLHIGVSKENHGA